MVGLVVSLYFPATIAQEILAQRTLTSTSWTIVSGGRVSEVTKSLVTSQSAFLQPPGLTFFLGLSFLSLTFHLAFSPSLHAGLFSPSLSPRPSICLPDSNSPCTQSHFLSPGNSESGQHVCGRMGSCLTPHLCSGCNGAKGEMN